ncbi:MAG TPA: zinc metallopeptidase [Verrucomicrobiae bacterium]|nr:zinc metallopeptidase [Verrucomicrobiae bacterium]
MTAALLFLLASVMACLVQRVAFLRYGTHLNRRRVTGSEAARFILDECDYPATSIERGRAARDPAEKKMTLSAPLYEGVSLWEIAAVAREAALWARFPGSLGSPESFFSNPFWEVPATAMAWAALVLSMVPGVPAAAGKLLSVFFGLLWIRAAVRFMTERKAGAEALRLLKKSGYFEMDEIVRLKKIFKSWQGESFAVLVQVPAALGRRLARKFVPQGGPA